MLGSSVQQEIAEVVRLRDEQDKTFSEIGEILGFSESTAKRRYKAGLLEETVEDLVEDELLDDFPDLDPEKITKVPRWVPEDKGPIERFRPLVVEGDAVVTCDWHIPLHDPKLINDMLRQAREQQMTRLIIGGDFWNMDSFSSYLPHQPEAGLQQERYDGNLIMKILVSVFDEITFIWGNHDFRLAKKLGFKKSFEECMKWMFSALSEDELKQITFSELDYMYYYPEGQESDGFRICHPRNFSSNPLTVTRKLAQKYNMGVITAHSHHCAMGVSPNGRDLCLEGGGFFDKRRTEYIQKSTTHHEWVPGYTIFKNGTPTLYSPLFGNTLQGGELD